MPERPLLLKLLLRERHWQSYGTFCAKLERFGLPPPEP
jgi:hypothetical protein